MEPSCPNDKAEGIPKTRVQANSAGVLTAAEPGTRVGIRIREEAIRKRPAKRVVTIALVVVTLVQLSGLQLLFLGVHTFAGINALAFLLPLSSVFMVLVGLHLYQTWPLARAWLKKSKDKAKQRDKAQRMLVLLAFVLILGSDMVVAWYYAVKYGIAGMPMESIRLWSWVATGFLVVHVWQRWRLTLSYFRPGRESSAGTN
jgi:hypothetical protein